MKKQFKFAVLVGVILASFAFAANASAALYVQYSSNGGPWQTADPYNGNGVEAVAPLMVRVTYYVDPNGDPLANPELTSYRWSCDGGYRGANQTNSTGPSVVCNYGAPGPYAIRLDGNGPQGPWSPGVGVRALAPGDFHQPIHYVGPTTLYRATVWGIQSVKPYIGASVYFGQGGYDVDTAKCLASMPAGTRCFRLGKNSPTRRSVLIEAHASAGEGVNSDKLDQHVNVLRDPSTTRTHKKVGSSCSYGTRLSIPQTVPAAAAASAKLEGKLPGKSWKVLARRTVRTYLSGPNRTLNPQVKYNLGKGTVQQYAAKKAAFRFTYASSIGKYINYYQFSKISKVTARSITNCS